MAGWRWSSAACGGDGVGRDVAADWRSRRLECYLGAAAGLTHAPAWWWSDTVGSVPVGVATRPRLRRCRCSGQVEVARGDGSVVPCPATVKRTRRKGGQFEDVAAVEVGKELCNTNEKRSETKKKKVSYARGGRSPDRRQSIFVPADGVVVVPLAWAVGSGGSASWRALRAVLRWRHNGLAVAGSCVPCWGGACARRMGRARGCPRGGEVARFEVAATEWGGLVHDVALWCLPCYTSWQGL
ncbi:hypothetical protein EDB85DRAFT_1899966 [Lactarius pseudohatsudake]|nr:hypothetical protein EDB85DRAFT_1899966 [Lactarius pseudohatsudake]